MALQYAPFGLSSLVLLCKSQHEFTADLAIVYLKVVSFSKRDNMPFANIPYI